MMSRWALQAAAAGIAWCCAPAWALAADADGPGTHSFGRLERAKIIETTPIEVPARLDAGTDQTNLFATDIKYFSGEGGMWVVFTVSNGEAVAGREVTLKEPVLRDQKVRERTGGVAHRPVVKLNFCIGNTALQTDVNILERTAFTAPLVLSRADVSRLGSVDAQKQYLAGDPDCKPPAPK